MKILVDHLNELLVSEHWKSSVHFNSLREGDSVIATRARLAKRNCFFVIAITNDNDIVMFAPIDVKIDPKSTSRELVYKQEVFGLFDAEQRRLPLILAFALTGQDNFVKMDIPFMVQIFVNSRFYLIC